MIDHRTAALAARLEHWLAIDSTTENEKEFLLELEAHFQDRGWLVERQPVKPDRFNLLIRREQRPIKVLFSTHVDTVPPFLPVRREGTRVYGRGACDTKGGLLAMVEAGERLLASGHQDIGFLLVVGEEVDHCGAKAAAALELEPEVIVLCEPTENRLVRAQKGMLKFTLRSAGRAGHSAFPDRGISAINPLLDALERLREADYPDDPILGPTTLNIGVLQGGVAANVFAPSARAEVIYRVVSPVEELLEQVQGLIGSQVLLENPVYNDPVFFEPPQGFKTCTVPFNTDATYLNPLGKIWLVGPGDIRVAHSDQEHIDLNDLQAGIDLYESLARLILK